MLVRWVPLLLTMRSLPVLLQRHLLSHACTLAVLGTRASVRSPVCQVPVPGDTGLGQHAVAPSEAVAFTCTLAVTMHLC